MLIEEFKNYEGMAKLSLKEEERSKLFKQVLKLKESFKRLSDIDTENVEPLITVLDMTNVLREDIAKKFIEREELLENAVEEYDGYFQVPKTID